MHQKEISNKAKIPEIAKTKTSSSNNRVRCNKNAKLTKKSTKPQSVQCTKKSKPAVRVGKNRETLKN